LSRKLIVATLVAIAFVVGIVAGGQVNAIAPGYINRRFLSRVLSAVVQFKLGRFHQRLGPQREMKLVEVRRSSAGNRKHDIG